MQDVDPLSSTHRIIFYAHKQKIITIFTPAQRLGRRVNAILEQQKYVSDDGPTCRGRTS